MHGMTIREFARETGIEIYALTMAEDGKQPLSLRSAHLIARYIGVTANDIVEVAIFCADKSKMLGFQPVQLGARSIPVPEYIQNEVYRLLNIESFKNAKLAGK